MKFIGALLIVLSVVTPASSVFIIAPGVIQQAGTGAWLSFGIAAIICLFTAWIYAELSSAFPLTGGEYAIVGRVLGPLPGFIILGLNLVTMIIILAVIALGIGNYLQFLLPDISVVPAAMLTVVATTLFSILNIRTNAVITGIFLLLELLALGILVWLGFSHPVQSLGDLLYHPVRLATDHTLETTPYAAIGIATSIAIFAYNGYGAAVYLGEETHNAPKHIARAVLWALSITVVVEALPVTAVLIGTPDLPSLLASKNMFGDFVAAAGGQHLAMGVSAAIALAILNANIATTIIVARLLYSTGRDKTWASGINHALTRIHKRFHSPWVSTLICGALALIACNVDLNILLVLTGTGLVVIYAALCVAVIVGRKNGATSHAHYKMPIYPLPPILALIALAYVVYANFADAEIGRPSLIATAAIMAFAALYYLTILKRRGPWVLISANDKINQ
jgi:amino acid transporter